MYRHCCAVLLVIACSSLAQTPAAKSSAKTAPKKPKAASVQPADEYGQKILEAAAADAGSLEPGTRAYVHLQLSRCYLPTDKAKALELLESAFAASAAMPDDDFQSRDSLREEILSSMVSLAPARVDELLPQLAAGHQSAVLDELIAYYEQTKHLSRAIELLQRIAQQAEVSYSTAERLMAASEGTTESQRIFLIALASFRDHEHGDVQGGGPGGDFARLVLRYWEYLPEETVRQSIDEMLKQAKESDKKEGAKQRAASVATAKGSVSLGSAYEYRLFQLVPILREIDESAAKSLLRDYQNVSSLLRKYPDGTRSLYTADDEKAGREPGAALGRVSGSASADGAGFGGNALWSSSIEPTSANLAAIMAEMHRAQNIVADATNHPDDAMANMAMIMDPNLRAAGYEGLARTVWRDHRPIAHSALDKVVDNIDKVSGATQQIVRLQSVAELYLKMEEPDNAKRVIEKGFAVCAKAYKKDTDADDPNQGFKPYWPSVQGYSAFARLAAKISSVWAAEAVKQQVPEADIRAIAEVALAGVVLQVPNGATTIMDLHKKAGYMMTLD